jgi:hypothetical protein
MSDRPIRLVLPPDSPFPDLDLLRDELERLREELRRAGIAIDARGEDRAAAERLDLRDQAAAVREGKRDPGTKRQDKVDKEKEEWEHKFAAIQEAIRQVTDEVVALVEERREDWKEAAESASSAAREAYLEALAQAVTANAAVREANALLRWVSTFPDMKSWKAPQGLTGLRSPAGDPYTTNVILDGLIEEASLAPHYDRYGGRPSPVPVLTHEEAVAQVEREREQRIAMGAEERPRPMRPPGGTLPPNAVIGGQTLG